MPRFIKPAEGAHEVQIGPHGKIYKADRGGGFQVDSVRDAKILRDHAQVFPASNVAHGARSYWVCQTCGWEAQINSCPRCKVEGTLEKISVDDQPRERVADVHLERTKSIIAEHAHEVRLPH